MARLTAILLPIWAFLLGPALCMGGMLKHPCDRSGGIQHRHEILCGHEILNEQEDLCQHEDSCAGDPCSEALQPKCLDDYLERPEWCEVVSCFSLGDTARCARLASGLWAPPPPDRPGFTFAPSDRPLRI